MERARTGEGWLSAYAAPFIDEEAGDDFRSETDRDLDADTWDIEAEFNDIDATPVRGDVLEHVVSQDAPFVLPKLPPIKLLIVKSAPLRLPRALRIANEFVAVFCVLGGIIVIVGSSLMVLGLVNVLEVALKAVHGE